MTIDEAIQRAREVACGVGNWAYANKKLYYWLTELKDLRKKLAAAESDTAYWVETFRQQVELSNGQVDCLREKLAAAESHNAVLRRALEFYAFDGTYKVVELRTGNGGYSDAAITCDEGLLAKKALRQTPAESAARVQRLVDALIKVRTFLPCKDKTYTDVVDKALAEWEGKI